MKKLKKLEKILLIMAVAICICSISTVNKATGTGDVNEIFNIQKVENNTVGEPANNEVENINTIGVVQNTNTNTNTTLPKTGVNDTAMWVLIGACAIAAIYTYKKVRDYNI